MKSELFSLVELNKESNKDFFNDIKLISGLPIEKVLSIAKHTIEYGIAPSSIERRKVSELAASECEVLPKEAAKCLRLFSFFADNMVPGEDAEHDSPLDLATDLSELGIITEDKIQYTEKWLSYVRDISLQTLKIQRIYSTTNTGFPSLSSIGAVVDFRAVFDHDFNVQKENVATYSPKCIGMEPVVAISLKLNNTNDEIVCFHTDKRTLKLLQDILASAQKELDIATKFLNLKETDGDPENAKANF